MAATLGLRSLVMLVGAGYTGSFFYNNIDLERARAVAAGLLLGANDRSSGGPRGGASATSATNASGASASDSTMAALAAQVDRLTTEVARRADPSASAAAPVLVLPSAATGYRGVLATVSDAFNLLGWAAFGVSVSGAVYYVAVRKRVALRDLAWVSQGTFNGTVAALKSGLQRVNTVVSAVSAELTHRLGRVENRVDDVHDSLKAELAEQVGRVSKGVSDLTADVASLGECVDETRRQLEAVDGKIDFSNHGIAFLVQAVAKLHPDLLRSDSAYELLSRNPGVSNELRVAIEAVSAAEADQADARAQGGKKPPGVVRNRNSARTSSGGLSVLLGVAEPASETVDAKAKSADTSDKKRAFDAWGVPR